MPGTCGARVLWYCARALDISLRSCAPAACARAGAAVENTRATISIFVFMIFVRCSKAEECSARRPSRAAAAHIQSTLTSRRRGFRSHKRQGINQRQKLPSDGQAEIIEREKRTRRDCFSLHDRRKEHMHSAHCSYLSCARRIRLQDSSTYSPGASPRGTRPPAMAGGDTFVDECCLSQSRQHGHHEPPW